MKNFAIILVAALTFGSLCGGFGRADDVQSQIQAAYDGQCKAAVAKDAATFQKFFDPKFVENDLDGKHQTIDQIVTEIATPPAGFTITSCTFAIRKITVDGGAATVLATQTAIGTFAQGGGAPQPFQQISETTDTWNVSTAQETSATETGNRITLGGKVVQEEGTMSSPAPAGN